MYLLVAYLVWDVRIDGAGEDACYSMTLSPSGNPVIAGNYGVALYAAELAAADGSFLWQYIFAFPGDGRSNVKRILLDPSDSTFVMGGTVYPYSGDDLPCGFVAKMDSAATVWMYVDSADGCGRREGFSGVTIGDDGHYYAYGTDYETYSADWLTPSRRFVLKLERSTGSKLWRYEPGGYSYTDAAPSPGGGAVVVGFGADGEVQRVDATGSEVWSITPSDAKLWGVAISSGGHPVVVGSKDGDFYVAQLQMETGGTRWSFSRNGSANATDVAFAVATDPSGGAYVAGYVDNGLNGRDALVVRLDSVGAVMWEFSYNGPFNSDDVFTDLLLTPDGRLMAVGYSINAGTGRDMLLVSLNPETGDTLWVLTYDSPYSLDDEATAVAVRGSSVFICGNSYKLPTDRDIVLLRYEDLTAVEEMSEDAPLEVIVAGREVRVISEGKVEIYDAAGRKFTEGLGPMRVVLRRGVWFVKVGRKVRKILLR
ncbi:MAG: PQQ-like beta-propeller repeat protein [Thermotogae bacterium]|nr:PQQ-like beta-propeller repeat protein [Thermotogota bacterium]